MRIAQGGKVAPPGVDGFGVERGGEHALLLASIGDDDAVGIDDDGSARVGKLRLVSDAIDADHVGLIFNRPRLQKREPVLLPLHRPECD